jgi:hypothetical protein
MIGRRRQNRKRRKSSDVHAVLNNEPTEEFLAALQEQRKSQTNNYNTVFRTPKHVHGFYFDEKRGKYFKMLTSDKRRYIRKDPSQEASTKTSVWTNFFRSRESNWMWSATRRDRHEIVKLQVCNMVIPE